MQRRKRYGWGYLLVVLAAVGGFLVARDAAKDLAPPTLALPAGVGQVVDELDVFGLLARLMPAPAPAPTTVDAAPTRAAPPPVVQGIEPTPTPPATVTPTAVAPPAPPVAVALPFALARPPRHDGDCSAASIRGSVRDAAGNLLAGVRIWRYDQWGNEDVTESRGGDAERGQYEFTFGDTANVHFVQVIDAGGSIISTVVQIDHRQGDAADALCHWVDWQQQ